MHCLMTKKCVIFIMLEVDYFYLVFILLMNASNVIKNKKPFVLI